MSRYFGRDLFFNKEEFYEDTFDKRDVNGINQYATPILQHPTKQQIASLRIINHVWKTGDRYYKLAFDHYGDSRLWWVIAWFNKRPTEADVSYGDVIYIPQPLDKILNYLGV
jgi:nucleoid-associated protein YgaU